jgi:hypothetical protein
MGNWARKIIEAIQNTFLDKLFLAVWPLIWAASYLMGRPGGLAGGAALWPFAAWLVLLAAAWLLGVLARIGSPQRANPYDPDPNGFSIWGRPPANGLHPPRFVRILISILAWPRAGWASFLHLILGLAGLLTVAAYVFPRTPTLLVRWVGEPERAQVLAWIAFGLMVGHVLTRWARDQRLRLEGHLSPPRPAPSASFEIATLSLMAFAVGAFAVITFDLPLWVGLAALVPIAIVCAFPSLRNRGIDALFGKREDPAA